MSLFSLLAKVLFVGHRLVGPDLPPMVEAGLRAMEVPAKVEAQIINGAPLRFNWDNGATAEGVDALAEIAQGGVTTLILTEAIPLAAQIQWNDSAGYVARYAKAARDKNPDAQVYVYETWHSLNSGTGKAVPDDPGATLPWRARIDQDLALWREIAGDQAQIIPAGQAMGRLADEIAAGHVPGVTDIHQLFADDIHPNGKGLYFVAMVHLATLTGKSPEGLPERLTRSWPSRDAVITADEAAAFQRIAWEAVQAFRQQADAAEPTAPAPPPAAKPGPMPAFQPITNPNLFLGLNGVVDWTVEQPFLDVMKTARPWVGHLPGQWGGWEEADLRAAGALDAQGWPVKVPPEVTGIATLILTDLPADAGGVAGRYVLTHDGKGTLQIDGLAKVAETAPGRVTFDYAPGPGAVILTITETDPADPIRNIKVVREDREASLAAGGVFNPDWLARIKGVRGMRFMGWMNTNDATLAHWQDRPKLDDYSWARVGVPVEVMVALANRLQAEPWFCMPHQADDGFVRAFAETVKAGLDPGLRVWVEYSNEVWNWQFAQAAWAEAQGKARWGQDATWVQFYALRASEVMAIWSDVMADPARLVRVVATQTGYKGLEEQILSAPLVMAEGRPAPFEGFDAYAVTGYFSGLLGADHKTPAVRDWLAESLSAAKADAAAQGLTDDAAADHVARHRFDLAVTKATAELRTGETTGVPEDTLDQLLTDTLPYQAGVAAKHGLKLVMYEGGTHVVGFGSEVDDEALTEFFTYLNYTPEMGALYESLLAGWAKLSDQPFNAFVDVSQPTKWGSWGGMRHLWDENPRWLALARGCAAC